ncbi:MAG: 3-oxoacyl-ACP reductase, partial [Woeseia sp.]|nr:3-oxoacyl-ACP reductase [Woeseia sp.]
AGVYSRVVIAETPGVFLPVEERDADHVAAAWQQIAATDGQVELQAGGDQTMKFLTKAAEALGIKLGG